MFKFQIWCENGNKWNIISIKNIKKGAKKNQICWFVGDFFSFYKLVCFKKCKYSIQWLCCWVRSVWIIKSNSKTKFRKTFAPIAYLKRRWTIITNWCILKGLRLHQTSLIKWNVVIRSTYIHLTQNHAPDWFNKPFRISKRNRKEWNV